MKKLTEKQVNAIYRSWYYWKPQIPERISLTINIDNRPNVSDFVMLFDTELNSTIQAWDSNTDDGLVGKFKEYLRNLKNTYHE